MKNNFDTSLDRTHPDNYDNKLFNQLNDWGSKNKLEHIVGLHQARKHNVPYDDEDEYSIFWSVEQAEKIICGLERFILDSGLRLEDVPAPAYQCRLAWSKHGDELNPRDSETGKYLSHNE